MSHRYTLGQWGYCQQLNELHAAPQVHAFPRYMHGKHGEDARISASIRQIRDPVLAFFTPKKLGDCRCANGCGSRACHALRESSAAAPGQSGTQNIKEIARYTQFQIPDVRRCAQTFARGSPPCSILLAEYKRKLKHVALLGDCRCQATAVMQCYHPYCQR